MEAPASLFVERGYYATSLQDVARAAGLHKRLIGYYFVDKVDLFRAVVGRAHAHLARLNFFGQGEDLDVLVASARRLLCGAHTTTALLEMDIALNGWGHETRTSPLYAALNAAVARQPGGVMPGEVERMVLGILRTCRGKVLREQHFRCGVGPAVANVRREPMQAVPCRRTEMALAAPSVTKKNTR